MILCKCTQILKTLAVLGAEKSVMKILYLRKKKCRNKGYDKHWDVDSLLHNTTSHTQCVYEISKS